MTVITAYKCDEDGKIFEDKKKYQNHLRKLAADRRRHRKIEETLRNERQWWHDNFWNKVKSISQLQVAILHHAEVFGLNGLRKDIWGTYNKRNPPTPRLVKFNTFKLTHNEEVSNTHDAPVNGVTNWGGQRKLEDGSPAPRSYPGWQGRFDYLVAWQQKWSGWYPSGSDSWIDTRINTGSGGGGGFTLNKGSKTDGLQDFGYQVCLFEDDWPGLKASYDEAREARDRDKLVWLMKTGTTNGFEFDLDAWVNEKYPAEDYLV